MQLSPTEASVVPNSSSAGPRGLGRRKPRQQIRTAAREGEAEAFDRLKGPAIVDVDGGECVLRQQLGKCRRLQGLQQRIGNCA